VTLFLSVYRNVLLRLYASLKKTYTFPNERCPLVDTQEFAKLGKAHPSFGKPVNEYDLFHGAKKYVFYEQFRSILQNGFDGHYFKSTGMFGEGAYFADDPSLSMVHFGSSLLNEGHMFVCNVILGNMDDTHYQTPLHISLGDDFRPNLGVDSIKGRTWMGGDSRQAEYIVYRFGQFKATYLLVFDH
jgi:hypothetical protein